MTGFIENMLPMKLSIRIFVTFFLLPSMLSAQKYTISGFVYDATTKEPIIGAIISSKDNNFTATNSYGFYSLKLNKGINELKISCISYNDLDTTINLSSDKTINFYLAFNNEIGEVVVTSNRFIEDVSTGTINLSIKQTKILPSLAGETDILKTLQLLPGINGGAEGMSGFFVRGGTPDQNLIILDDVPIYGSSHLFGFLSVFNEDAIKSVRIIKDGFPAEYSGRLSSVLDVRMKDGDNDKITGNASIGLVSSKVMLNGPIVKDKITFLFSYRRSYYDIIQGLNNLVQRILQRNNQGSTKIGFYDLNFKITSKISDKDKLYVSFYTGRDHYKISELGDNYKDIYSLNWQNTLAAIKWTHIFGNSTFWNNQISYTSYNLANGYYSEATDENSHLIFDQSYSSYIKNVTYKNIVESSISNSYKIKTGFDVQKLFYLPGQTHRIITVQDASEEYNSSTSKLNSVKANVFLENKISIARFLKANLGFNYSMYWYDKNLFNSYEPRVSLNFIMNNKMSIKTSYAYVSQDIHLLTNSSIGLPSDIWVPATDKIIPEKSQQVSIGYYLLTNNNEFSLNFYYKKMTNLIAYKPGTNFFIDTKDWENKILPNGNGEAYGMEFFYKKNIGKVTGWLSYALAWNYRQFADLNNGEKYPFKYDQRHNINIVAIYKINDKLDFSATWSYHSGNAITIPVAVYQSSLYPPPVDNELILPNLNTLTNRITLYELYFTDTKIVKYSNRNEFRMPAYHRLDISFTYKFKNKLGNNSLQFGLYNAYNHKNPYYLSFYLTQSKINENFYFKPVYIVKSLIPILPFISYSVNF